VDAYFALDPNYRNLPEADWHGFRALSERSMLADSGTDSGVVSMFPKLAETWQAQVNARARWKTFELADFQRLKQTYGVDWVVLDSRIVAGLECPYRDGHISVCRVP
jgi:hypothetical protein